MSDISTLKGTLGIGGDGAFRIQFERHLPHAPARVWEWITEADRLEQWLPGSRIDATVGGAVHFDFGDEGAAAGTVSEVIVPGEEGRLVHSWIWEGVPDSRVIWTLHATAGGTLLTLVHSEVLPEPAAMFAMGWHIMLDALTLAADGGSAEAAWQEFEAIAGIYLPAD